MTRKTLRLDDFLPYRLSVAANLVSDVIAGAYAKMFDLSVPEWRLVAAIAETDGMTQNDICARTRMDKVTVSRAAISLAGRSLIVRNANPNDGRSNRLSLSDEGRQLYSAVVPQALNLEARIFGNIDATELERFSSVLGRIATAAEELVGNDSTRRTGNRA